MLGRAIVPRLRPRLFAPPVQFALSNSPIRYYSREKRPSKDDYKLPESAKRPIWQQPSRHLKAVPKSEPEPEREQEFHEASHEEYRKSPPANVNSRNAAEDSLPEYLPEHTESQPLDPKNYHQESVQFEPERVEKSSNLAEPVEQSEEETERLRRTLPDLTQGIPSTLAAELGQARGRQEASATSLNITEDPEGQAPETQGGGRGGDGLPQSSYVSSSDQKKNAAYKYTYLALVLGTVGYAAYLGRNWDNEEEENKYAAAPSGWGLRLFYNRVKARLVSTLDYYNEPMSPKLLPDENPDPKLRFPFTLVLSLEDLMIHNEWTREHGWRVAKRPGLDYFLRYLSQYYELVLFTSQPSSMADQVLRKLDPYTIIQLPLFREATLYKDGGYVKDLSYLNRPLNKVIIIDTDPHHVKHQPENAIVLPKWTGDPKDSTLVDLIPFLEYLATMGFDDSRPVLKSFDGTFIPAEFARREKLLRQKFEEKRAEEKRKRPRASVGKLSSLFGVKGQLIGPDGQPIKEDDAEGPKMLWDQIREQGQKQYMAFEKQIREEGEKWLKERAEEEKKFQDEQMKNMKSGFVGWFGGGGEKK